MLAHFIIFLRRKFSQLTVSGVLLRLLIVLIGLISLLYLYVFAVNWQDEAPSSAAKELTLILKDRTLPAQQNAYAMLIGLDVERDTDPYQTGIQEIAAAEASPNTNSGSEPRYKVDPFFQTNLQLPNGCDNHFENCLKELWTDTALIQRLLFEHEWVLHRYEKVLNYSGWQVIPLYLNARMPSVSAIKKGQWLFLLKALSAAQNDQLNAVAEYMTRDIQFWRHCLETSNALIFKMISAAQLRRDFELVAFLMHKKPALFQNPGLRNILESPLTSKEQGTSLAFAGNWAGDNSLMHSLYQSVKNSRRGLFNEKFRPWDFFLIPLYQPQATSNQIAEDYLKLSGYLDVPIERLSGKIDHIRDLRKKRIDPPFTVYNPVGRIILKDFTMPPDVEKYSLQVAE